MKKTIAFLVLLIMSINLVSAFPDIIGRGNNNPQGVTEIKQGGLFTGTFAIYDLQDSYKQGSTIKIGTYQTYIGGCNGQVKSILEVYNAPTTQQTTSTYIGGQSKEITNPVTSQKYYFDMSYVIPSNAKIGTWSLSAYLLCTNPSSVVSRDQIDGTKADERNFAVISSTIQTCTPKQYIKCSGGDYYYYDSCGVLGTLYKDCSSNTMCNPDSPGNCISTNPTDLCSSHAFSQCYQNNIYWYNNCGEKEDLKTNCQYGCSSSGVCNEQVIQTKGITLVGAPTVTKTKVASGESISVTQKVKVDTTGTFMLEAGMDKTRGLFSIFNINQNSCDPQDTWYKNQYVSLPAGEHTIVFNNLVAKSSGTWKVHTAVVSGCGGEVISQVNGPDVVVGTTFYNKSAIIMTIIIIVVILLVILAILWYLYW